MSRVMKGLKTYEQRKKYKKLNNEIFTLYNLSNIVRRTESRKMRWTEHADVCGNKKYKEETTWKA